MEIVDDEILKELVHSGYALPGQTYFGKNVLEPMYVSTKQVVKERVKNGSTVEPIFSLQQPLWQTPHNPLNP